MATFFDWGPFFQAWDLAGAFPGILSDAVVGLQAQQVYAEAQSMLEQLIREEWLSVHAVFGCYVAASDGDDIVIFRGKNDIGMIWYGLRQQYKRPPGKPNLAMADFISEQLSGIDDYIGCFAVTVSGEIERKLLEFKKSQDDYNYIMLQALADRFAEAAAEWLHLQVRTNYWGYSPNESLSCAELITEKYQGIRPAPGYPACPDHTPKQALFELLGAEEIGLSLTESFAMLPVSSISGFYLAHPQAHYFAVGTIGQDQLQDVSKRRQMPIDSLAYWLAPNLSS